jgi:endonuclease YncB( thermonuclease family)
LNTPAACDDVTGRVVVVTGGDTLKVLELGRVEHKVRLTGIDAPEQGQPYGTASTKYLAPLVAGKEVLVESTKSDRYGRTLIKVWVQPADCPTCDKTLDVNHAQLLAGTVWWYRYYAKEQPQRIVGGLSGSLILLEILRMWRVLRGREFLSIPLP